MRAFSLSVLVLLAACGSSGGEAAGDDVAQNDSGAAGATAAGTGGGRADAAAGGAVGTGGKAGSGGSVGSGGASGTGGKAGSGGSTAAGGSAGTGGRSVLDAGITVRPCSDLSPLGTWQNISPAEFRVPSNMEAYTVAVDPQDQTVYATAGNKTDGGNGGTGVMKSTDCGATWTLASTGTNGDKLKTGGLWALLVDPAQNVYVANGYGNNPTIYKSTNGGVDFAALNPDPYEALAATVNFVQAIALEPGNLMHLAVTFHDNCKSPHNVLCFSRSTDGGATWQTFDGPSSIPGWTISGWEEGASISILGSTSYLFTAGAGIWYTSDVGAHWKQVVAQYIQGSYSGMTHITSDGTLYIGGNNVFVSAAAPGADPPFALAAGKNPTALAKSPAATVIVDDGVSLFASLTPSTNTRPFWTAPLSAPTAWTQMPDTICGTGNVPSGNCRGSNEMAYDSAHHVLYSANWGAGLWRLVTR
jgi:hypothetical protein